MNLEIVRYSFFHSPKGTLRYTEHLPPHVHTDDHALCNCTTDVKVRPQGEPHEVQRGIQLCTKRDPYDIHLNLREDGSADCGIKWPRKPNAPHAYFWFSPMDHLKVEVTGTDDAPIRVFYADLYFGPKVDTTRFFNGHSLTRLKDIHLLAPDAVWIHACEGGREAMTVLSPDHAETLAWQVHRVRCSTLRNAALNALREEDLPAMRDAFLTAPDVVQTFEETTDWLLQVLKTLPTTELARHRRSLEGELGGPAPRPSRVHPSA